MQYDPTFNVLKLIQSKRIIGLIICSIHSILLHWHLAGFLLRQAVQRVAYGGRDVTCALASALQERGYSFTTACEWTIVCDKQKSQRIFFFTICM